MSTNTQKHTRAIAGYARPTPTGMRIDLRVYVGPGSTALAVEDESGRQVESVRSHDLAQLIANFAQVVGLVERRVKKLASAP
jgi:hypothetical protein